MKKTETPIVIIDKDLWADYYKSFPALEKAILSGNTKLSKKDRVFLLGDELQISIQTTTVPVTRVKQKITEIKKKGTKTNG